MSDKKIAIITGATAGIGAATVKILNNKNIPCVAVGRRQDKLMDLENELSQNDNTLITYKGDVTQPGLVKKICQTVEAQHHLSPNIFILSAGRGLPGTVLTSDKALWNELIQTNYLSVLHQLNECAEYFSQKAEEEQYKYVKDIVVIGSTIGRQVSAFNPVYGSTKFAVHSITEALRQELCNKNIRVTLIEPGFVKSEFQAVAGYDPTWVKKVENEIGQMLLPEDVARTIDFVIHQPAHVHLDDIRIHPTKQKNF